MCTRAHRRSCECACYTGEHMCLWTQYMQMCMGTCEYVYMCTFMYVSMYSGCSCKSRICIHRPMKFMCEPQACVKTQPMHVFPWCTAFVVECNLPTSPWSHGKLRLYKQDPSLFLFTNVPRRCVMVETAHAPQLRSNNKKSDHQSSTSKKGAQSKSRQALCHLLKNLDSHKNY